MNKAKTLLMAGIVALGAYTGALAKEQPRHIMHNGVLTTLYYENKDGGKRMGDMEANRKVIISFEEKAPMKFDSLCDKAEYYFKKEKKNWNGYQIALRTMKDCLRSFGDTEIPLDIATKALQVYKQAATSRMELMERGFSSRELIEFLELDKFGIGDWETYATMVVHATTVATEEERNVYTDTRDILIEKEAKRFVDLALKLNPEKATKFFLKNMSERKRKKFNVASL